MEIWSVKMQSVFYDRAHQQWRSDVVTNGRPQGASLPFHAPWPSFLLQVWFRAAARSWLLPNAEEKSVTMNSAKLTVLLVVFQTLVIMVTGEFCSLIKYNSEYFIGLFCTRYLSETLYIKAGRCHNLWFWNKSLVLFFSTSRRSLPSMEINLQNKNNSVVNNFWHKSFKMLRDNWKLGNILLIKFCYSIAMA